MSFSSEVKEELARLTSGARHCKIAELAGILNFCGEVREEQGSYLVKVHTENVSVAKRFFTLLKDTFGIHGELQVKRNEYLKRSRNYSVFVDEHEDCVLLLKAVKYFEPKNFGLVLQNTCCKRAYIRGAFLAAGSMSDPEKNYHFEIVTLHEQFAEQLQDVLDFFELDAKIVIRKKYYVVYIKEGAKIVDVLNIMEAHIALMNLENVRILKDMRNTVNRRVNCETANINKTVSAAVKQAEDIRFLQEHRGLSELNQGLQDIAYLRLEHPEATLKELGEMLNPPVGKSGVNHRLKKLSKIAEDMRMGGSL